MLFPSHTSDVSKYYFVREFKRYIGAAMNQQSHPQHSDLTDIFFKITKDMIPASTAVLAKFIQIPVSPKGHRTTIRITGKIRAVDTEISVASFAFSTATI